MYKRISQVLFPLVMLLYFLAYGLYLRLLVQPLCYVSRSLGVRLLNPLIRSWGVNFLRIGMLINRMKIRMSGFEPEPGRPYLILSNHQSIIDIVILFWAFRGQHVKFVMKKELKWGIPNVSPATRFGRFAFLDRNTGARSAERVLADFCDVVKEERTGCVMFPEGTRSCDGNLGGFKVAGVATLAEHLDLSVLVITIDGTWRAGTLSDIFRNSYELEIRIHIEPPRPVTPFRQKTRESLQGVRDQMKKRLATFRDEAEN
jgi:1-acyl-sn-glycerol-3-phosphate acyltransferase